MSELRPVLSRLPVVRFRKIAIGAALLLAVGSAAHSAPPPTKLDAAVLFDFGAATMPVDGATLRVGPAIPFAARRGFGWRTPDAITAGERPDLSRSRSAPLRDHVAARSLGFRVVLQPGTWMVRFWAEAGSEDTPTLRFEIDGAGQALGWHRYDANAEPRTAPRKTYRLYSGRLTSTGAPVDLTWQSDAAQVQILALELVPVADALPKELQDALGAAGDHRTRPSLVPLVERLRLAGPVAAVAARHAETLALAERDFEEYRGWEWARLRTGLSMFDRYEQAVALYDGLLADPLFAGSVLHTRALYGRARLNHWRWREQDGANARAASVADFDALAARGINDPVIRMYRGERVRHDGACDRLPKLALTPVWAARQNETLCRLRQTAHWWIDVRQAENGELGGKLGDDVEITRWWSALLLAGDTKVRRGWLKLADAVWNSDLMLDGYTREPIDVEHAAEPSADTALVLALSGDPTLTARLSRSSEHFRNTWTAVAPDGVLRFRSAWFGTRDIDNRPPRDRDVPMNARAVKAARYDVFLRNDAATIDRLRTWAHGWAQATMASAKGKPIGVVPPSVRFADGAFNGDGLSWHKADLFWHYYEWDHDHGVDIYDQLLFMHRLTGDVRFVRPVETAFALAAEYLRTPGAETPPVGSRHWAARELASSGSFRALWAQWRLDTGERRHDDVLASDALGYLAFRMSGDEAKLNDTGREILETLRFNEPLRTEEVLFTDRVAIAPPGRVGPAIAELIAMMTGSYTLDSPGFAVTWESAPDGFTALVRTARPDALIVDALLFDHGAATVDARLWGLQTGFYTVTVRQGHRTVHQQRLRIDARGTRLRLPLPAQRLATITVAKS